MKKLWTSLTLSLSLLLTACSLPSYSDVSADELSRRREILAVASSGNFAEAEKKLHDHLKPGPNEWDMNTLSTLLSVQGHHAESLKVLPLFVRVLPSKEFKFLLGQTLLALDRPKEAIEYLKASADDYGYVKEMGFVALGMAYQSNNQPEQAIAAYRQARDKYPEKMSTFEARAWSNLLKAEPEYTKVNHYLPFATSCSTVKWPLSKMPLKVFIEEDGVEAALVEKYRPELLKAFGEWASASNEKIAFTFVKAKDSADIECRWPKRHAQSIVAGHAQPAFDATGVHHADITMQTITLGLPTTPEMMHILCLHEIGHALGLMHSPNATDVMGPLTLAHGITERDKNTLLRLYSPDVSVEVVSSALIKNETDPQMRSALLGSRQFIEKNFPAFLETAKATIAADPTTNEAAKTWNALGLYHKQNQHWTEAETCFKNALAITNQTPLNRKQCMRNYAIMLVQIHRDKEGKAMYEQALAIPDEKPE